MKKILSIIFTSCFILINLQAQNPEKYESIQDSMECSNLIDSAGKAIQNFNFFVEPYLDKAETLASKLNNNYLLPKIYIYRAVAKYAMFDHKSALIFLFKADTLIDEKKYPDLKALNYLKIANIYIALKMYDEGEAYLNKSQNLYEIVQDKNKLLSIKMQRSVILLDTGKSEESLDLLKECERTNSDTAYSNYILSFISETLDKMGEYDQALEYYFKLLEINNNPGLEYRKANNCLAIGKIYVLKKEYEKAFGYIKEAKELAQTGNNKDALINAHYLMYEHYMRVNNPAEALVNYKIYVDLDKELSQDLQKREIELIASKNKYRENINMIQLENKMELSKKELRIKYLILATFIFMVSFLISFSLFLSRKNAYKKLIEKNKEVIMKGDEIQEMKNSSSQKEENKENSETGDKELEIYNQIMFWLENKKIYTDLELTQQKLAEKINIKAYKLSSIINKNSGSNFIDLLNNCRIKHAQRLLANKSYNKYSIAGIAEMSGYKYVSTFHAIFKKATGVTPSFYRKNSQ